MSKKYDWTLHPIKHIVKKKTHENNPQYHYSLEECKLKEQNTYTPTRITKTKSTDNAKCWYECEATVVGNVKLHKHFRKLLKFLIKLIYTIHLKIPLPDVYSREMKI